MSEELLALCKKFIEDQYITCSEAVYQSDRVIEKACEFIEQVCEIVGYAKSDIEDEE